MALQTSSILKFLEDELVFHVLGLPDGIRAMDVDGGERSWRLGLCHDCHVQAQTEVTNRGDIVHRQAGSITNSVGQLSFWT